MKNTEETFKLIGIQPHSDCDQKFTKVLKPGRMYQFYSGYKFLNSKGTEALDGEKIVSYKKAAEEVPEDLYDIGELAVNISAVVGKNGSGKSSLIELLLYSIYKLGITLKDEKKQNILKTYSQQAAEDIRIFEHEIKFHERKIGKIEEDLKDSVDESSDFKELLEEFAELTEKVKELNEKKFHLQSNKSIAEDENLFIILGMKCSVFFEIGQDVYELNTDSSSESNIDILDYGQQHTDALVRNIKLLNLLDSESHELLSAFFYTMVLNYSHHGLNSSHLGLWITTLFHKNDGYKAPGVINPMRVEGNFDINTENDLARSRLLMNLLIEALHNKKDPKKIKLTDKQYIYKVCFKLQERKGESEIIGNDDYRDFYQERFIDSRTMDENILELLPLYYEELGPVVSEHKNLPYTENIINYLARKIPKALRRHPEYNQFMKRYSHPIYYFKDVLPVLKKDRSHVTFKIERAMFYLKKLLDQQGIKFWGDGDEDHVAEFDLYELLDWMEIGELDDLSLIFERIPPSIFNIDFVLDNSDSLSVPDETYSGRLPTLQGLSSGEQQKIHIINGVVYHLNNIYSVHKSDVTVNRLRYSYVNIIFDEIELYFHPDLQREFIYDLLENIKRLPHITRNLSGGIKGLNLIFSTHSPFILSDIPVQNILKIEYKNDLQAAVPVTEGGQTFGANIHDLLANSFFFKNKAFSGEKADDYLKNLIQEINLYSNHKKIIPYEKSNELLRKASLIGENFFREKLIEMISSNSEMAAIRNIEGLIEKKKRELEDLEKRKNNLSNDTD